LNNGASTTLQQGIASVTVLPGAHAHTGESDWDRIILPDGVKERLKNQAILTLLHREQLRELGLAPQGLVVFAGPPGTGKTTLARGLAFEVAHELAPTRGNSTFIEIDPHSLPSEMLGESQRAVMRLLTKTIPEYAQRRSTTMVLIDEVEAFAVRRSAASFETNPADLHRATDAVLMGMDQVAREWPGVFFIATTNFIEAIDEAMLSRADLILPFRLATADVAGRIVTRSLKALAAAWPPLLELAQNEREIGKMADALAGWDGRRLTKLPLVALARRAETVKDPGKMTFEDLWGALEELNPERFAKRMEREGTEILA
jgi:SpoVK/Ycf46/Vps4 family AAA+-type ATPase